MLKDYLSKGCVFEVLRKRRFEVNVNQTKKVGEWRLLNGMLNQDIIELMAKKPLYFKIWKRITSNFAKSTLFLREANNNKVMIHMTIFLSSQIFREKKKWVSICIFAISRVLVSISKEVHSDLHNCYQNCAKYLVENTPQNCAIFLKNR